MTSDMTPALAGRTSQIETQPMAQPMTQRIVGLLLAALVAAMPVAGMLAPKPAHAQNFSEGYEFLEAVRDKDGDAVTEALSKPGSTLIHARDITSGESALHIVVARRDVTWIRFLARHGANPNVRDNKGVSPMVLASRIGFVEGVEALIEAGAEVDESNSTGETPLIAAVHNKSTGLMRILLKAGADPDRADNSGRTARDYATLLGKRSQALIEIERADEERKGEKKVESYGPSI